MTKNPNNKKPKRQSVHSLILPPKQGNTYIINLGLSVTVLYICNLKEMYTIYIYLLKFHDKPSAHTLSTYHHLSQWYNQHGTKV